MSNQTMINNQGTWRELLTGPLAPIAAVLAGGVLIEASNVYLTTSLLPTIVEQIGGIEFYAWTMTAFLVASVIMAMLVGRLLTTQGAVRSYLLALGLFAVGSLISAAAVAMPMLLVGRAVQGLGGGLLAGLGYALIQRTLPERLWTRAAALVSAMWGIGNIIGPVVGGLFGQFGAWRAAFIVLAAISVALAGVVLRSMPRTERSASKEAVPVGSLVLLTTAVAAVSVASILPSLVATVVVVLIGAGLTVAFLAWERRSRSAVLPKLVFEARSPLKWVYLAVAVLAFGIGTEAFLPLFGQEIGGLDPLIAGLLGAALSFGWSLTQMISAGARTGRVRLLITAGPLLLATGLLAYGLLQREDAGAVLIAGWFVTLFAAGAGIGMAFPHLTVAALGSTSDEEQGAKAAAAINTVLIIANAFSAALAGVLVNLGSPSIIRSAQLLMIVFAVIIAIGAIPARRAVRPAEVASGSD
ncbi:MFS transporter [Microlunatus speluncae]|uniref:MFS transporter n=1 Tax=Microlunatus speluncae TaxID=2594267 RepID=UPI001C2CF3A5|nr:MFS transporter [Microlunatus speluncae]